MLTAVVVFLMLLLYLPQIALPLLTLGVPAYLLVRHFRSTSPKKLGGDVLEERGRLPRGRRILRAVFGSACLLSILVPGFLVMGPMVLMVLVMVLLPSPFAPLVLPALVLGFYLLLSRRERKRAELVLAIAPLVIGYFCLPRFLFLLSTRELSTKIMEIFFLLPSTIALLGGLFMILDGARGSTNLVRVARVVGVIGFGALMTFNIYSSVILAPPSERGYSPFLPPPGEPETTEGPLPPQEAPIRSEIISSTPTSITVATETYQVTLSPRELVIPQGGEGELILNFNLRLSGLGSETGIKSPHHDAPFWKPKQPNEGWIKPFNATACKFTPKISEYAIPDTYSVVLITDMDGVRAEIPFTIIVIASPEGRKLPPLSFTIEPDEVSVKPGGSATITLKFNRERYGSGVSLSGDVDLLANFSASRKSATEWVCALQFAGDASAGTYELMVIIEDEGAEIMVPLKVVVE